MGFEHFLCKTFTRLSFNASNVLCGALLLGLYLVPITVRPVQSRWREERFPKAFTYGVCFAPYS